jgi:hypothetical protein
MRNCFRIVFLITVSLLAAGSQFGQGIGADGHPLFGKDEEQPKSIKESIEKMRIDKEKKDHDQMVARGEEIVKISNEVHRSFTAGGLLSKDDLDRVAKLEKLVKKVREELGGDEDEPTGNDGEATEGARLPSSTNLVVEELKVKSDSLFDQLKQTTRFTISAAAITSANTVLRIARFLKLRH